MPAVNLDQKLSTFTEHWSPRIVETFNGHDVWHRDGDTGDFLMVLKGRLTVQLRDKEIHLRAGDPYVVPKGVEHRPVASEEAPILLIEAHGTPNTGDAGSAAAKQII